VFTYFVTIHSFYPNFLKSFTLDETAYYNCQRNCSEFFLNMSFALSRSYWVGDISWTHNSLFLACVLKRGSLLLLTCLGELLTLVTCGCSIEFGPAEFIPLHPLITYRWDIHLTCFNLFAKVVLFWDYFYYVFFLKSVFICQIIVFLSLSLSSQFLFLIYSFLLFLFCCLTLVKIWHYGYVSISY
jgi:hypothetical protein